jgi:hypothetical protein
MCPANFSCAAASAAASAILIDRQQQHYSIAAYQRPSKTTSNPAIIMGMAEHKEYVARLIAKPAERRSAADRRFHPTGRSPAPSRPVERIGRTSLCSSRDYLKPLILLISL